MSLAKQKKKVTRTDFLAPIFVGVAVVSVLVGEHSNALTAYGLAPSLLLGGALLALVAGVASIIHAVRLKSASGIALMNAVCIIYAFNMLWAFFHLSNIWFLPSN
jgi:hypothetical protein